MEATLFMADCCFHSIKPLYTDWWWGQAIFCGLAGRMADALPIVGIVLYWSNAVGRLLSGIFESAQRSVVGKQRGWAVLIKKRWRSNLIFSNFIRRKFFEDPTFVDSNFFSGTVPVSILKHYPDSSTEIPLWTSHSPIDILLYRLTTYYYRGPIVRSEHFFFSVSLILRNLRGTDTVSTLVAITITGVLNRKNIF